MPKISVIVPVYRAEAYLGACIDSILSQSVSDFELFLVNDGSPDNCGAICDAYAQKDSRIRVIHQENQGQAAARNHAFSQASGEWVCFVDSDDLIHPHHLQLLLHAAESTGAQISMCEMLQALELPETFMDPCSGDFEALAVNEEMMIRLYDAEEYPAWVACGKLIRRELIEQYPFCQGRIYEDNEAVCRWVCAAQTMTRIPAQLYYYRTNPVSTTQNRFTPKKLDYLWALESIIGYYSQLGWKNMEARFTDRYAKAVENFVYEARLFLPEEVKNIERSVRRYARKQGLRFTREQKECMVQAMHPKLMSAYWPAAAAVRTVREQGVTGFVRKVAARLGKGEGS